MRKHLLMICALIITHNVMMSQSCLPEGITFTTQNQIDSFQVNYPGCTEILGDVYINGGSDITSLAGLDILTSLGGYLDISNNDSLTSLAGLDNLTYIEDGLWIVFNNALTNLTGLEGLTSLSELVIRSNDSLTELTGLNNVISIGGPLDIWNNPSLISTSGLNNLTIIGGDVIILWNNDLTSLTGLNNITSISGGLNLKNNNALASLTGLSGVTTIGGNLQIHANNSLTGLAGLDNLTSIGGTLLIHNSIALNSLTALNNMTSIGGALYVVGNDSLNSLMGLDNIEANTISDLHIFDNTSLSTCEVQSICDYLVAPSGTVEIYDNMTGCNSKEEVEEACDPVAVDEDKHDIHCSIYPNPSSRNNTFIISLKKPMQVYLVVLDRLGSITATVVEGSLCQGDHHITWNADGITSGIYFYCLNAGNHTSTGKLIIVR